MIEYVFVMLMTLPTGETSVQHERVFQSQQECSDEMRRRHRFLFAGQDNYAKRNTRFMCTPRTKE
jgi:hypothetical protein